MGRSAHRRHGGLTGRGTGHHNRRPGRVPTTEMTEPGARQGIAAARRAAALAAAIVALALAAAASGASGSWSTGGPTNADVTDLVVDPDTPQTVYAASDDGGVYKSIDGGESWASVNTGLASGDADVVNALAIDPETPQTLYAATQDGIFKTTNGAASWTAASEGITAPLDAILSLAIDPSEPETLYAGGRFGGGVFKTTDGGGVWSESSSGLVPTEIAALAVDPETPETVYAGSRVTHGVYKSIDGGASWSAANTGLGDPRIRGFAIDPSEAETVYAATFGGVFKSSDGGAEWSAANGGFGVEPNVEAIALDPADPDTLYVGGVEGGDPSGVYRSLDGGGSWSALNAGLPIGSRDVTALITTPSGGTIYAGTATKGVYQYTLEGGGDDEDPPETFITAGPGQGLPTTDTTPSFSFSADEAGSSFVCEVDGGVPFACTSPHQLDPLADGPHSFAVFATDPAGNPDASPAERSFFVDSEPSEIGVLTQKAGSAGCLAAESHQGCATAATAREAYSVAVSPDGRNVYAAGASVDYSAGEWPDVTGTAELSVFDRDGDGALTAAAGHGLESGSPDETAASGFDVAVSPDGTSVYATSVSGVAVFDRAPDGSLTRDGGVSLPNAGQIELSLDGASAYVTTAEEVAIFDRAPSGTLVADGSVSLPDSLPDSSSGGPGHFYPDVAVSPDGENVYVAYTTDYEAGPRQAVIATFDRAPGGALAGSGCVSEGGENGCADGFGLYGVARGLAVSPDGANVYVASSEQTELQAHRGQIAVFDRAGDGSLSQKGPGAGCISGRSQDVPAAPGCAEGGRGLQSLSSVAVSPEGSSVYAVSRRTLSVVGGGGIQDGMVAALDRGLDGTLSPKPSEICCVEGDAAEEIGDGRGIVGAERVAVSPDGRHAYSAALGTKIAFSAAVPGAVGVFDRVPGIVSETDPPQTTITLGPAEGAATETDSPLFGFSSDEPGSTFSCSVDDGGFFPCSSPHQLGPLADGPHSFAVFATDLAGNPDATPAERTFTVDSEPVELLVNDEGDGGEDDEAAREACEEGTAGCTLRGALVAANGDEERNRITFAAGIEEIEVVEDQLVVEDDAAAPLDVEIAGRGTRALTVSEGGGSAHPALLEVKAEAGGAVSDLSLSGFSYLDAAQIEGGGSSAEAESTAAAVINEGELSLQRVTIADSTVSATAGAGQEATAVAVGGGILNRGGLTVIASTVSGGEVVASAVAGKGDATPGPASAMAVGGGIVNDGGNLRLERSTVSGNFNAATAVDGSPNSASSRGGGIANEGGAVELDESTVAFNTAGLASNLFTSSGATTEFRSTLLTQPSGGENCDGGGDLTSAGFNLEDADSCELDAGSDQTGADPALAPLADNGGPTDTHAIAPGSDALDAGDAGPSVATDQRSAGFSRPVNFPAIDNNGDGADVGAYELQPGSEGPVGHPSCSDGFDNDADGFADGADPDCQSPPSPPPPSSPTPPVSPSPPPSATPPPATVPDNGIPRLRAAAPRSQKQQGKKIALKLSLGAPEQIRAKVTGTIKVGGGKYRLKALRRKIAAGKRATVRIKPASRRDAKRIAAALKRWRGAKGKAKRRLAVKAVLKIVVTDGAGNREVKRQLVTLR